MIITSVHLCNFKMLYDGLKEGIDKNIRFFGGNAAQLYEHVSITLEISGIAAHELLFLKKLAKTITILNKSMVALDESKECKTAAKSSLEILALQKQIDDDEDISTESNLGIMPIGMLTFDVLAVFDGMRIGSVVGTDLYQLFANNVNMTWMNLATLPEEYPGDKQLEEMVKQFFIKNFYETIEAKVKYIDILSDYTIANNFYSYADDRVNLAHVNSPYGAINFFSENKEDLPKQVEKAKEYVTTFGNEAIDMIDIIFTIKSTFASYFDFTINTPYVINHIDYKILLDNDECEIQEDIMDKYSIRITEINEMFLKGKKECIANSKGVTSKLSSLLQLLRFGQIIKYNIKIPLSRISTLGESLEEVNNIELMDIINQISSISSVVTKSIGISQIYE